MGLQFFCLFMVGELTHEITPSVWYVSRWATKTRETPFAYLLRSKEWFLKSCWVANEAICGQALERLFRRTGTDIDSVRSISIVWIISLRWGFVYCTLRGNPAEELKAPGCVKFCRSKEHMKILKRHGRFPLTWISHISVYIGHILASNKLPVLVLFCSN